MPKPAHHPERAMPIDEAWRWVADHLDDLRRIAYLHRPPTADLEDFRQDLIVDVADALTRGVYDPARGRASNWIHTRAQLNRLRHHRRERRMVPTEDVAPMRASEDVDASPWGAVQAPMDRRVGAQVDVSRLLDVLDDGAWDVAVTKLLGWSERDAAAFFGVPRSEVIRLWRDVQIAAGAA